MPTMKSTAMQHSDMLLEIDVRPGDAALLRVVSTLHQRQAHVRTLTYDDSNECPRLSVRVVNPNANRAFLVSALQRCVDVLSVRVPTFEGVRGRRAAGRSPDGRGPATLAPVATHGAERVWA